MPQPKGLSLEDTRRSRSRDMPEGALDIVIPDLKQSIRDYIVQNIGYHVTRHARLHNTEIIAMHATPKTIATAFLYAQVPCHVVTCLRHQLIT